VRGGKSDSVDHEPVVSASKGKRIENRYDGVTTCVTASPTTVDRWTKALENGMSEAQPYPRSPLLGSIAGETANQ
jgi:hypothetical protein